MKADETHASLHESSPARVLQSVGEALGKEDLRVRVYFKSLLRRGLTSNGHEGLMGGWTFLGI